jgi:exodeoxyribonuclease VIII
MNQQYHLMIDVETLGVNPHAPIMQIGAILFDSYTGAHVQEYCANIEVTDASCERWGLKTDQSTIDFWAGQPVEIWESTKIGARPLEVVMPEFFAGLGAIGMVKETPIWSHATFDFPLVNHHLQLVGCKPLYYRAARDIRTLVALADIDLKSYDWNQKTHNALDDCRFQVKYCVDAMAKIRKGC